MSEPKDHSSDGQEEKAGLDDQMTYLGWSVQLLGCTVKNPHTGESKFFNTAKEAKKYIEDYQGVRRRPKSMEHKDQSREWQEGYAAGRAGSSEIPKGEEWKRGYREGWKTAGWEDVDRPNWMKGLRSVAVCKVDGYEVQVHEFLTGEKTVRVVNKNLPLGSGFIQGERVEWTAMPDVEDLSRIEDVARGLARL
jgi:hypothetical protein